MKRLLAVAAFSEVATGVALMAVPSLVGRLLLGVELIGVSVAIARVTGISLFTLGLACWPTKETSRTALCAMLIYDLLVTLYLLYICIRGEWIGPLLWPAVAVHAVLTVLLTWAWINVQKGGPT
jgi:hypothetical protein